MGPISEIEHLLVASSHARFDTFRDNSQANTASGTALIEMTASRKVLNSGRCMNATCSEDALMRPAVAHVRHTHCDDVLRSDHLARHDRSAPSELTKVLDHQKR